MTFDKKLIGAAIAAAMTMGPTVASAALYTASWTGFFTMINPSGGPLLNTDGALWRSPVSGTFSFDTATGAGTGTVVPFSFFGSGVAIAASVTMQAIGDGFGGPGSLVLANMSFNWNNNNGIPVSLVMDAAGFFGCLDGSSACTGSGATYGGPTTTISGVGALAATEGTVFGVSGSGGNLFTIPLGPAPMVTTDWNTTTIGGTTCGLGCNPSGTLPLVADTSVDTAVAPIVTGTVTAKSGTTTKTKSITAEIGGSTDLGIGGSPMPAGPFAGFNANFDITEIHIDTVSEIPVPAAVWLLGSGLAGVLGVARRRKVKATA